MDEQVADIIISPTGTRHYLQEIRTRYGLGLTRCGIGIDRSAGWGRGLGRTSCTRCEDSIR